ncbi:CUE domain-containing protein [Aspergillus brunneoviolaceus CBS 621.78]|uniref:Coupling of ubiquitin conjugation to ER degradation protein 1 n=2 Tax=Aspergillus TaxID=5052 RepID=A0A8G1RHP8_9EURO|nr:putative AMFR protein [Aspergillus brunneoviolaceus CBS 621.78]XP_040796350.1 putative AMFR protein [Aspergillus fijiensis CBS 313.89]RAH46856.1 putative AMFR protein [Aspergillus brunneoviolaceus CBS 621.78]RAK72338.1 putative AMFR protein [Aspergillus fijiensis CBS 313.89]
MPDEEPSLNIPSLLTLAVVSFFVIRWFFNRDGDAGAETGRSRTRGNGVDPAHVEQISQMFPQLSHREIMWDLQRNGGNMAATTERILTGRGLEVPPPSFQPQIAIPTPTAPVQPAAAAPKADGQDLISRYNLRSKVGADEDAATSQAQSSTGWSQSKEERQRLLQKRRDDMILAARRKMMQKDQTAAAQ